MRVSRNLFFCAILQLVLDYLIKGGVRFTTKEFFMFESEKVDSFFLKAPLGTRFRG